MYNFHFYFLISTRLFISVSVFMIVDIDLISLLLIFSFVQGMKLRQFYFFVVEISSAVECIISLWESLICLKGIGTISLSHKVVGCVIEMLYATQERWLSPP